MFAQEANMHENRFNEYRIPSGMLIVFLEKALTLIHMETHLDDVSAFKYLLLDRGPTQRLISNLWVKLSVWPMNSETSEICLLKWPEA